MTTELVELKAEIRAKIESEFTEDVHLEFIEGANRLDVRVSNLGLVDELGGQGEDLSISKYSDLRFTVMTE